MVCTYRLPEGSTALSAASGAYRALVCLRRGGLAKLMTLTMTYGVEP